MSDSTSLNIRHGGVKAAERFDFELEDPVLGRSLRHGFDVEPLLIVT